MEIAALLRQTILRFDSKTNNNSRGGFHFWDYLQQQTKGKYVAHFLAASAQLSQRKHRGSDMQEQTLPTVGG